MMTLYHNFLLWYSFLLWHLRLPLWTFHLREDIVEFRIYSFVSTSFIEWIFLAYNTIFWHFDSVDTRYSKSIKFYETILLYYNFFIITLFSNIVTLHHCLNSKLGYTLIKILDNQFLIKSYNINKITWDSHKKSHQ